MEKRREFIINVIYFAIMCAIVYICFAYLVPILLPFILGFLFAYAAINISRSIFTEDTKISRGVSLVLLYLAVVAILAVLISLGITKLGDFAKTLPAFYKNTLDPFISSLENSLISFNDSLPENIEVTLDSVADGVFEGLKNILSSVTSGIVNITTSIISAAPELLISIIVLIVSSFYIVSDYENIIRWFATALPERVRIVVKDIGDFCQNVLFKIVGSYVIIMFITFIELLIGLSLIGINNSAMWAFIISFLDILPILGVGTVLIPWGISMIIAKKALLGIEILILYVVMAFIRNIIEPRLVGTNLGLHPLVALVSMLTGVRLFGIAGMLGLPLILSFLITHSEDRNILMSKYETDEQETEEIRQEETEKVSLVDTMKNSFGEFRKHFDK